MKILNKICILLLLISCISLAGSVGSRFSYQGQLLVNDSPANGMYDFKFELWTLEVGGTPIGAAQIVEDISVKKGVFTTEVDFGDGPFDGEDNFLKLQIREGASTGAFTQLSQRHRINAAPYAIQAEFVENNASPWQVSIGEIGYSDDVKIGNTATVTSSMLTVDADAGQSPIRFKINGSTRMIIGTNGGTAIGGGSPPANGLLVSGETRLSSDVNIGNPNTVTDSKLTVDADSDQSPIRFKIDGSTRMIIESNGGTAIGGGSAPPANGLRVAGQAAQALTSHGFVKAGVFINCGSGIDENSLRYFNNVNVNDFFSDGVDLGPIGNCIIGTPFDISDAYYVVSAVAIGGIASGVLSPNCSVVSSTELYCQIINSFGSAQNGELQLIFY